MPNQVYYDFCVCGVSKLIISRVCRKCYNKERAEKRIVIYDKDFCECGNQKLVTSKQCNACNKKKTYFDNALVPCPTCDGMKFQKSKICKNCYFSRPCKESECTDCKRRCKPGASYCWECWLLIVHEYGRTTANNIVKTKKKERKKIQ